MISWRLGGSLILAVATMLGCGTTSTAPSPESSAGASAGASASASASTHPASSSAPTADASASASASAAASAASSGLPAGVTSCEKATGHFGGFTPSVQELVDAGKALETDVCIPRVNLEAAIRACAAQVGGTALNISADDFNGPRGCSLRIAGGAAGDRKWVVFAGYFRSGATFDGGSTALELGPKPTVYLDALGKHNELCPLTSSTGKLPKDLPSGWAALPGDLKDFLCSGPPVPP